MAAQSDQDPTAKKYLDALSAKSKNYKTIEVDFESRIVNSAEGINISQEGNIKIKDKKYRLKLDDTDIIADGTAMYTVSDCECYINDMPDGGQLGVDPSNIFTIYDSDFKYKMVKETTIDGKDVAIIEMFPKNPKEAQFISITLTIDKKKMEPYKIVVKGREGNSYTYKIKKFSPNKEFSDSVFKFSRSAFPCVEECTDLREE